MRVDDEGDGLVEVGKLVVGAQRNEDVVAHPLHIDDDSSRMFRCEAAGERGNHPAAVTFSMTSRPFLWNCQETEPASARLQFCLEKMLRISATVRFRLSLVRSINRAQPPGP